VPHTKRSLFVDIAIILALGLIAYLGYKFSPLLLPKADLTLAPAEGCDLNRQACHADLPGGGRIELAIGPQPIPVIRPLQAAVTFTGLTPDQVTLDFAGVAMDMGLNRVTLVPSADGRFVGETTIPVCVTGRMVWRATLVVEADRRRIAVPFLFEAPTGGG
jgi:hypothetical protein